MTSIFDFDEKDIEKKIAKLINEGKVGIIPCDTIYGISARADKETAERILEIKRRPKNKSFITLTSTELLKKSVKIIWNKKLQASFDELKRIVTSAPCLKLPDFTKEFEAITDASGIVLGRVLVQEGRPVAFTSRKLKIYELNYATHDLELLVVIHALKI